MYSGRTRRPSVAPCAYEFLEYAVTISTHQIKSHLVSDLAEMRGAPKIVSANDHRYLHAVILVCKLSILMLLAVAGALA